MPQPSRGFDADGRPVLQFGDVAALDYPYTERLAKARRPVVVVSQPWLNGTSGMAWVAPVTVKVTPKRRGDVALRDAHAAGLGGVSEALVVRTALVAAVPQAKLRRVIGRLDRTTRAAVLLCLQFCIDPAEEEEWDCQN